MKCEGLAALSNRTQRLIVMNYESRFHTEIAYPFVVSHRPTIFFKVIAHLAVHVGIAAN